ncbi:MAG TPA: hypothetical protein VJS20_04580 [Gemmatimonadales bacterium]|nr:hypothetical protein [Gemmatimonadales bacterium]
MPGIGPIQRGSNGVGPFQNDHHYADLKEPGRHEHGEHDAAIGKIIGLEQRNKGRTSKQEYEGAPPMRSPGEYTTEKPQPTSGDRPATVSRP